MRSTVTIASTLVIHPTIRVPEHCAVCAHWNIERPAVVFGQWEDQNGPDHYIGICAGCAKSGFQGVIGTLEEFKAAQLRAMGLAEYEVYGNKGESRTQGYKCTSRVAACARIRKLITNGISIDVIYQRSVYNGRLNKLNQDDKARLVIEAMNAEA